MKPGVVRALLFLGLIVVLTALVAWHGARGIATVAGILLLIFIFQTPAWKRIEGVLVRITGSRQGAFAVVLGAVVAGMFAFAIVNLMR
jgi:hypothetical protein